MDWEMDNWIYNLHRKKLPQKPKNDSEVALGLQCQPLDFIVGYQKDGIPEDFPFSQYLLKGNIHLGEKEG